MPIPAVAIVVVGVGAAVKIGTTYMVCKQQDKARESQKEMMEMMMQQNEKRSQQMMEFLKWQSNMCMQRKQNMINFLGRTSYGSFAAQCLAQTM